VRSIMSNSGQSPLGAALFVLLTICITQPTSSLLQQKYGLTTGLKCNALVAHPILRSNTEKFLELRSVHSRILASLLGTVPYFLLTIGIIILRPVICWRMTAQYLLML
jgi:hypothetical protein